MLQIQQQEDIRYTPCELEENKRFDFINIELKYDKVEAERRYQVEYDNNTGGIKDCHMSFNQWLTEKEIEALVYQIKSY